MTQHISAAGKVWRTPVRRPDGGQHVTFWANTAELAALRAYAAVHGVSLTQAAKQAVQHWMEAQNSG